MGVAEDLVWPKTDSVTDKEDGQAHMVGKLHMAQDGI